jgi:hypothetical protein
MKLFTVKEIATEHRLHRHTVLQAFRTGCLKVQRVGRKYFATSEAIEEWRAKGCPTGWIGSGFTGRPFGAAVSTTRVRFNPDTGKCGRSTTYAGALIKATVIYEPHMEQRLRRVVVSIIEPNTVEAEEAA